MGKKYKRDYKYPFREISSVVSSTECTGLTQFIPETEHEVESFRHVYDIPLSTEQVKQTREKEKKPGTFDKKKD
ncbi:MAG: hypothetical protein ACOX3X_09670 [Eubacteriales bacterium]|jgi:hypothetical protein